MRLVLCRCRGIATLLVVLVLVGALWVPGAVEDRRSGDSGKLHPSVAGAAADRHGPDAEPGRLAQCNSVDCPAFMPARSGLPATLIASGIASVMRNDEIVDAPWISLDPPVPR